MKRIICGIISFLLVLSMVSCGKAQPEPESSSITDKLSSLCLEYGYFENEGYRVAHYDDDTTTMMMYPEDGGEYIYFIVERNDISLLMVYEEGSPKQKVLAKYLTFGLEMYGEIPTSMYNSDYPMILNISGGKMDEEVDWFYSCVNLLMARISLFLFSYNLTMQDLGFICY